jgi:hypothetical protein
MTTLLQQSNSRLLTLPRVMIVVSAVCFLALLAAARPVLSRNSPSAPTAQAEAQVQPAFAVSQKIAKPMAGKRKAAKDI